MSLTVEYADLGQLGAQLGRGGQAVVFEVPDLRLPDAPGPLVYKEYKQRPPSTAELRRIVALRADMSFVDRSWLDERSTWPLRVVLDGGAARGILMRRIPTEFGDDVPDVVTGGRSWVLREVQFLFVDPVRLGGRLLARQVPTWEQRLTVCREFAELLHFYHERLGVVFGDINPKNELYRLDGSPSVMFIDCDGVRLRSQVTSNAQLNAPDWFPPQGETSSVATDLYKLGLFVRRALLPGAFASTATDPAPIASVLDVEGAELLTRAIGRGTDLRRRPSAYEWWRYFSGLLGIPVSAPVLTKAELDRSFAVEGQPVELHWAATEAAELEVAAAGLTTTVDARAGSGVVPVHLSRAGHITVTAINPVGSDTRTVGPVAVIPPPDLRWAPLLVPEMPYLGGPTTIPQPTLPAMPQVVLPVRLDPAAAPPVTRPYDWPGMGGFHFPFDLTDLLLGGPALDAGPLAEPEGTT